MAKAIEPIKATGVVIRTQSGGWLCELWRYSDDGRQEDLVFYSAAATKKRGQALIELVANLKGYHTPSDRGWRPGWTATYNTAGQQRPTTNCTFETWHGKD